MLLYPLRLLAVVPGCIGTFWLLRNSITIAWEEGRLGRASLVPDEMGIASIVGSVVGSAEEGKPWNDPSALEFAIASLWVSEQKESKSLIT